MRYLNSFDVRRQHLRLEELVPLYRGTDEHGRTLNLEGSKLVPGHEDFIDYCISGLKIPDLFIDSSSKEWIPILGVDVLFTLFQFLDGHITNSDGETINTIPKHLIYRFTWVELEMNALNPGAEHRELISKIIKTTYRQS